MNAPTPITQLQQAAAQAAGRVLRREGTRLACPHCDAPSERCEKPEELSDAERAENGIEQDAIYRCTNYECGHCFKVNITPVRRLRMGLVPNPAVDLPMSMHIRELEKYNIMPGSVLGLHFPRSKSKADIHKKTASDNGERMTCIDCHADAVIRTSWQMSALMRETTYHCTNECCKGVFVAYVEIVCTISPSGIPRVNVQLPLSGHINRESLGIVLGSADAYEYTPRRTYPPANGDLFAGDRPAGTSS